MRVTNNGDQCVIWVGNLAVLNISTLKSVLLMNSNTSAGVRDCKREDSRMLRLKRKKEN